MSKRSIPLLLNDITFSIEKILEYTHNLSFENFTENFMIQDAVLRNFTIIGEAIGRLPELYKDEQSQIDWKLIKNFRNRIVHDYVGIDFELVWNIIKVHLPQLHQQVKSLITSEN